MDLDIQTVAFLNISLSVILSGFLFLARASLKEVAGSEFWAASNLLVCAGMTLISLGFTTSVLGFTFINLLIAGGLSLNLIGLQKFNQIKSDYRVAIGVLILIAVSNSFMAISNFDQNAVHAFNYLIVAYIDLSCAYMLFNVNCLPKRGITLINASLFLAMGLLMLWRGLNSLSISAGDAGTSHAIWGVDTIFTLVGAFKVLCTSLCFILMMHQKHMLKLNTMAMVDDLTGAFNRRGLIDAAEILKANCNRINKDMSLIVLDLDHFKEVNDEHGHPVGDQVLRAFADCVRTQIRAGDVFGRYGGEEFCVICPNTVEKDATALAERIRYEFSHLDIEIRKVSERFTVSAGVSCSSKVGFDFRGMLAAADSALYIAKSQGRNLVVAHSSISVI